MSNRAVAAGIAVGVAFIALFSVIPIPSGFRGDIEDVVISLERTRCFGVCPAYTVTIYGDGTVVYEGVDFVKVKGTQTAQIPQEDVRELVDDFYAAGFFQLRDRYEQQASDLPSQTTSITIDGTTKTVFRYGFEPARLVELEDRIDEVAGTEKWVK